MIEDHQPRFEPHVHRAGLRAASGASGMRGGAGLIREGAGLMLGLEARGLLGLEARGLKVVRDGRGLEAG